MADPAVVAALLLAHAEDMEIGSPALPIAYPEIDFPPPADGKYLRVDLFKNAPFWEGLKSGRIDQGLLQVSVVWPRGQGIIKPAEAAALVMAHWAKLTTLSGSGVRVKVNKEPWDASPVSDDHETMIPVTIPWNAA